MTVTCSQQPGPRQAGWGREPEDHAMKIVIYGDFGCPYSYLASLRADELLESGVAEIDWRAVAPDRGRPGGSTDELGRDLAAISLFAQPGERLPRPAAGPVDVQSAISAYAEAVSDGVPHQMRRRLFAAIWAEARRVTDVYEVRKLIADVMCPRQPILYHLVSPDLPSALLHDPGREPDRAPLRRHGHRLRRPADGSG